MPPIVRRAEISDADEIARVHVETWQSCYRGQIPDEILDGLSISRRAEQWRSRLSAELHEGAVFVADDEQELVGFASCDVARGAHALEGAGELEAIYLRPDRWRSGVGTSLLAAAEDWLRKAGFATAMLWVLTANEGARRFYEAKGWTFDGTEKMYHRDGHDIPELRYVKDLKAR